MTDDATAFCNIYTFSVVNCLILLNINRPMILIERRTLKITTVHSKDLTDEPSLDQRTLMEPYYMKIGST